MAKYVRKLSKDESGFQSTETDVLKDAQDVRKEILKNTKKEIENILVRAHKSTRRLQFDAKTNTYTMNGKQYTAECINDIQAFHNIDMSSEIDGNINMMDIESPTSGSICVIDTDDSTHFKTASVICKYSSVLNPAFHGKLVIRE